MLDVVPFCFSDMLPALRQSFGQAQAIRLYSTAKPDNPIPTWNDYFKLRKKRRMYEIALSVPSAIAPAFGSLSYFAQMQVDPFTTILGMDPVMAAALATVGAVSRMEGTEKN